MFKTRRDFLSLVGTGITFSLLNTGCSSKIPEEFNEIPNAKKIINETTGAVFNSVQDARRWVHSIRGRANNQPISACARGESCSAYGYIWRYL